MKAPRTGLPSQTSAAFLTVLGALSLVLVMVATHGVIGADLYWLVALGRYIASTGDIPQGIPFAVAPTDGWHNVPVLAELLLAFAAAPGPGGILALHLVLVGVTLAVGVWSARLLGSGFVATAAALLVVGVGTLATIGVVRLQTLSLVPFAVVLAFLRQEHERPSSRIWWLVPVCILWSNLHGAVLVGVGLIGAYLLESRLRQRPLEALLLGPCLFAALWATPAGLDTGAYYLSALQNASAARGSGLWAHPDLGSPPDLLMILAALLLAGFALSRRWPAWEYLAGVALALAAVDATRHGVWLLLFLLGPGAKGMSRRRVLDTHMGQRSLVIGCALCVLGATFIGLTRGSEAAPHSPTALVPVVRELAKGGVVLADEPLAESLMAEGVTVWASNPIDAFRRPDQDHFLDFLEGRAAPSSVAPNASVVVVEVGSPPDRASRRDAAFTFKRHIAGWSLYVRS